MASPAARVVSAVSAERKSACLFNRRRTFSSIVLYAPEVKMGDFISYVFYGLYMEWRLQIAPAEVTNPFFLRVSVCSKCFAPKTLHPNILECSCRARPFGRAWQPNKRMPHSVRFPKTSGQVFLPRLR